MAKTDNYFSPSLSTQSPFMRLSHSKDVPVQLVEGLPGCGGRVFLRPLTILQRAKGEGWDFLAMLLRLPKTKIISLRHFAKTFRKKFPRKQEKNCIFKILLSH
jgi:hypothetical protein